MAKPRKTRDKDEPRGRLSGGKRAGKEKASGAGASPAAHNQANARPVAGQWWRVLAVAVLPLVIYSSVLGAGFIWDDHNLVEGRPAPSLHDFVTAFTTDFWQTDRVVNKSQYYRPLVTASFLLDRLVFGPGPRGYHLTNLVLYSALCALAFLLFRRLIGPPLDFPLGLLFAALPAHIENVAWISGRTDITCALFMTAALIAHLRAREDGLHAARYWAAACALFFLSLLGKEMSITLPAAVALLEWSQGEGAAKAIKRAAPYAAVAVLFLILHTVGASTATTPENVFTTPGDYILNVLRNFSLGLWHSAAPGGYEMIVTATREQAARTYAVPGGWRLAVTLTPLAVALAALGWLLSRRLRGTMGQGGRLALFGLGSAVMTLAPVTGIIPIGVIFALRFLLIPGLFMVVAAGGALRALERFPAAARLTAPAVAAVAAAFSVIVLMRAPDWKSDETLMMMVLKARPDSALGHFIMGNAVAGRGDVTAAIEHYREALRLRPEYPEAWHNLGIMLQRSGRQAEAMEAYRKAEEQKANRLRE